MDRRLIRQVLVVSALAALAYGMLRAGGPVVLTLAGAAVAVAAAAGLVALVRIVVVSELRRPLR